VQIYRPNIKTFYKKKNKPSLKILASAQTQFQEMIKKFMQKQMQGISHECSIWRTYKGQTYVNYKIITFRIFKYIGKKKCDNSYKTPYKTGLKNFNRK